MGNQQGREKVKHRELIERFIPATVPETLPVCPVFP